MADKQQIPQQIPELDPDVVKVVKELEKILNIKFKAREWNPTTALFGMSIVAGKLASAGARTMTHLKQQQQEAKDGEAKKEAPEVPSPE